MFPEFQAQMAQLEAPILLFIQNNIRNPVLTPVMKAITHLGDAGIFWIILTLILLIPKKTRKAGLCSLFALACSVVINNCILKPIFNRTRPYEMISDLKLLVKAATDASFPSGHSGASFASAVALSKQLPRKYGVLLIILACLIAFSRLYVGIHFPTDVAVGICTGILCGFLGNRIGSYVWDKALQKEK